MAAVWLSPIALTRLPKTVRERRTGENSEHDDEDGDDCRFFGAQAREDGAGVRAKAKVDVGIVGEPPGQAANADHGRQGDDERLDAQVGDYESIQGADQRGARERAEDSEQDFAGRSRGGRESGQAQAHDGGGQRESAADAKIDARGKNDQRHPDGHDSDFGDLAQNVGEVSDFEEDAAARGGVRAGENGEQNDDHETDSALQI